MPPAPDHGQMGDVQPAFGVVEPAVEVAPCLTERELAVLRRVDAGARNRDIAASLRISTRTVEVHVSHILQKLGVTSRAGAVGQALCTGLVALDDLT